MEIEWKFRFFGFFWMTGGGYPTDLRQISGEEGRPEGAVRQGPAERLLPRQILGRSEYQHQRGRRRLLRRHFTVKLLFLFSMFCNYSPRNDHKSTHPPIHPLSHPSNESG